MFPWLTNLHDSMILIVLTSCIFSLYSHLGTLLQPSALAIDITKRRNLIKVVSQTCFQSSLATLSASLNIYQMKYSWSTVTGMFCITLYCTTLPYFCKSIQEITIWDWTKIFFKKSKIIWRPSKLCWIYRLMKAVT